MDPARFDPARKWRGYNSLRYLFIFGDSYSAVGFPPSCPEPSPDRPLGVPWPGQTWSSNNPVWVGHLINLFAPEGQDVMVYDYAVGGYFVEDLRQEVDLFMEGPANAECDGWQPDDSLFVTWIGVNDVAGQPNLSVDGSLQKLFQFQDELYRAGARNFLFVNIPPLPKPMSAEGYTGRGRISREQLCDRWNSLLPEYISRFASSPAHPASNAFLFDSHTLFSRILKTPYAYGFPDDDGVGIAFDDIIWEDGIHPTTATHKIVAREIKAFMTGVNGEDVVETAPRCDRP